VKKNDDISGGQDWGERRKVGEGDERVTTFWKGQETTESGKNLKKKRQHQAETEVPQNLSAGGRNKGENFETKENLLKGRGTDIYIETWGGPLRSF